MIRSCREAVIVPGRSGEIENDTALRDPTSSDDTNSSGDQVLLNSADHERRHRYGAIRPVKIKEAARWEAEK